MFNFWAGVMPPRPMLGRSLLYVQSHCVAVSCTSLMLRKTLLVEPFVAHRSVVAFDIGILPRLAGLDMPKCNAAVFGPVPQSLTDVFGPIVHSYRERRSTPCDDPVKRADDPPRRQREVHLDAKSLAVEVIDDIQETEGPPRAIGLFEAVGHEVHRPGGVGLHRHSQRLRCLALQPFPRFDAQIELQFAIDPVHPLVVPWIPLHVPEIEEAQPKAPCPVRLGQANQQAGDLLIPVAELALAAVAGLADTEGPAGKGHAHALLRQALAHWHAHFVENGPIDHFHHPATPKRFRRLPLN